MDFHALFGAFGAFGAVAEVDLSVGAFSEGFQFRELVVGDGGGNFGSAPSRF